MADIFSVFKRVRPRKTIKSDDFNGLQDSLKASFDSLGAPLTAGAPAGHLGVSTPFHVGTAVDDDHAATKAYVVEVTADAVQVGLDATDTAADRVQTGLDATATAADRAQTTSDATATAADRTQTTADATATAADRTQTTADATSAAASAQSAQDVVAGNVFDDGQASAVLGWTGAKVESELTTKLDKAGGTLTDYRETTDTTATAASLDVATGNVHVRTLTGSTTFTLDNIPATGSTKLELLLTAAGNTVIWPAGVVWESGSEPTLGTIDRIIFSKYAGVATVYVAHSSVVS